MKKLNLIFAAIAVVLFAGCGGAGVPGPNGTQEFLKGNKTHVLTLGSLISVSGDTFNITESRGTSLGYKVAPINPKAY